MPRNENPNPDRRAGQIAGDALSIPVGGFEAAAGGGTAIGGGTLTVATVGASSPITVPATAAGLAAVAHGTYASINAAEHLSKNLDERSREALGGDGKAKIRTESASGDGAAAQPTQKADSGVVPTTEPAVPDVVKPAPDPAKTRPGRRKATKQEVIERAPKTPEGDFIDPNTGKLVPQEGPYDFGHKSGCEWCTTRDRARSEGWTREQVIEHENNPDIFQIEDPSSNRSHKFEAPRAPETAPSPSPLPDKKLEDLNR